MSSLNKLNKIINLQLSSKQLILSAGMPRSGSTLLFNVLRESLLYKWPYLSSGWIGDISELPDSIAYLIKTHSLNEDYMPHAKHIFYTFRDVRVAAVSHKRKFGTVPNMKLLYEWINEYNIAKEHCDVMIKYENFISNPVLIIESILEILNINVNANEIISKTFYLEPPSAKASVKYSKKTLLHMQHRTYTKDNDWRIVLPKELQTKINTEFAWWFQECEYLI